MFARTASTLTIAFVALAICWISLESTCYGQPPIQLGRLTVENGELILTDFQSTQSLLIQSREVEEEIWIPADVEPVVIGNGKPSEARDGKHIESFPIQTARLVPERIMVKSPGESFRNLDGTVISAERLLQQVNGEAVIVIARIGNALPAHFATLFKESTIVALFPADDGLPHALPGRAVGPAKPLVIPKELWEKIPVVEFPSEDEVRPPPSLGLVTLDAEDRIVLRSFQSVTRPITGYLPLVGDQENQWRKVDLTLQLVHSTSVLVPGELITGRTVGGEPFGETHRKLMRSGEIPVVTWPHAEKIDPRWLSVFRSDALILTTPALDYPSGGNVDEGQ